MDNRSAYTALTLLSPVEVWDRVDPLASDLGAEPGVGDLGALPYERLLGPGFERLCYELLVAEGHSPRFFGRSGQRDHGVDILVEAGDTRTAYQCKNLSASPSWNKVRDAVTKFESDWLGKAGLSRPHSFVYCCPQPMEDVNFGTNWTRFKDQFKQRTGVDIYFWDKHALDTRLRQLPDIVAGLFSGSYAVHFCNHEDWLDDPWTRVRWGELRYRPIARFLDRHRQGAIHVAAPDEERFQEILINSSILAIRGLPGSGKTLTGLEMSWGLRAPLRRIYYATFKDSPDPYRLWKSVSRRCSLPAVLLLDDCHLDLEQTGIVLERLCQELSDPKGIVKLILVLRDLPGSASGKVVNRPDWLVELEQVGLVMSMKTDLNRTSELTVHLRPDLTGLSQQRLERLHHLTCGDLVLLDEILSEVESPQDLDDMRPSRCYQSLRTQYFGGNRRLPTVQRLACLAQFDLTPMASFLEDGWQAGEKNLVASLMTELFAPPRYQFLHSSLAELVLRALVALEVDSGSVEDAVVDATTMGLVAYFRHLAAANTSGTPLDPAFMRSLEILLGVRLKLAEGTAEAQMKARVLNDQFIRDRIEEHLHDCSFTFLHLCLSVLASASQPSRELYASFVERRFCKLFEDAKGDGDSLGMATVGTGFMTLARNAPTSLAAVEEYYGAGKFLSLIAANGTLLDLFHILRWATPSFREELLEELDETSSGVLVDRTIAAKRSIGSLSLALRELRDADENLLRRLEQSIGARCFTRLIVANGTLYATFRTIQCATPTFREALLSSAGALVDKTIATGRSIGTLNLASLELSRSDKALLGRLEQTIGAVRFLSLIVANGTLLDLFRVLQRATAAFREELLGKLDAATAGALVDKTIHAGRSIGTLAVALRVLSRADKALLGSLEQTIGAERFLRMVIANGTLYELFDTLRYATAAFREELLGKLDAATAGALVDKTIHTGRSIGTLHLALRDLGREDKALLGGLERTIGAERFLRLVTANGTLSELFDIIRYATPTFQEELLGQLDHTTAKALADKTIHAGRSIESFHYALQRLRRRPQQLRRLEELLGIEGWWRLIIAVGTLNSLIQITRVMSGEFRTALVEAASDLGVADWRSIITRSLFQNACVFAREALAAYSESSKSAFREALSATATRLALKATWSDLTPSRLPADPDSPEGQVLRTALQLRIDGLKPDDLPHPDLREVVNGIAFAWRERPDLRQELASRLWKILPKPADWPKEKGEIASLRLVLAIVHSELIATEDAHRLLAEIRCFLTHSVCAQIHTRPLFLFLWNLCALHFERGVGVTRSFDGALPDTLIQTLLEVLRQRVAPRGPPEEKLAQFALAGLVRFVVPRLTKELRSILAPLAGITKWPYPEAIEQTFVPSLFSLEGIDLLKLSEPVFTPFVRSGLLIKSKKYEDIGPAIEFLRQHVKHRDNLR